MSTYPIIQRLHAMVVIRRWRQANGISEHLWWIGGGKVGFIYFARAFDGTMKVGWSADPVRRVRGLIGHELVVAISGCSLHEEGCTHRFLGSISTPSRGREWYPAGTIVTNLALWLRNAANAPPVNVKAYPKRPFVELGKGVA